ncbi:MAG: putative manganese-dependent inorganic diphosphatase [Coriobacteriia bacterium]|nr:putative manganese-dependent inorganic diphosphatase [Coriobacteriia bacterium]
MGQILVFGHRNPDNDSICSAVAYAHLKNVTDACDVYLPVRLGPLPKETRWVFERFGLDAPAELEHVRTRVRDVMTPEPITIRPEDPMLAAGRIMRQHGVRGVPVVDVDGRAVGFVGERVLAEHYLDETVIAGFQRMPVSVEQLVLALDGELLCGDAGAEISGDVIVGAAEPSTMAARIRPGDTLIVGDRLRTQPMALAAGAACLISTGGFRPADDVIELARAKGAAVVVTSRDTYSAARLVSLAHAVGDLMDTDVLTVGPEALLAEAAEDLLASSQREAVVSGEDGRVVGILTRTDVARGTRRRVVLVDHNEVAQSALGIEDATVVEIVDHHRVGDIQSASPILFLNMPVGSTATIVAARFRELGVEIPAAIAGILLSAILTDTVLLKSPTTTDTDRRIATELASTVGVDPIEFGMELLRSRRVGEVFSAEGVVRADAKEFRVGKGTLLVSQYETVDANAVMEHADELRATMETLREARGYSAVVLLVTDIMREGSEVLAVGATRGIERALGISLVGGSAWMPGVLSRKKQIAARLLEAADA